MHTRVVLVLVSDRSAWYAHITAAALDCLRYTEPAVHVTLVFDKVTAAIAQAHYKHVLDRADCLRVVETAERGAAASRELKMRLREIISGAFTYMDADAFVVDRLPTAATDGTEFSIAIDAGANIAKLDTWHRRLGWDIPGRYYNGGVFWAKDTPAVHLLFSKWQRYWAEFRGLGSILDQPALNHAICLCNANVATMDSRYNAVFHADPRLVKNAAVLHFFASEKRLWDQTILGELIAEIVREKKLSQATLHRLCSTRYPWKDSYSFRGNLYAGRFLRAAMSVPLCLLHRAHRPQV